MGHCEMLLAVAGLDKSALETRERQLAGGDWSSFPPADRAAFLFARKQATAPSSIDEKDVQTLVEHFGTERALDVIWWACRCHYMTRVADAFQLPLEPANVFSGSAPTKPAGPDPGQTKGK
jgi:alkylhydroperoxidase family enzyme